MRKHITSRLVVTILLAFCLFVSATLTSADTSINQATNQKRASVGLHSLITWAPLQAAANRRVKEISTNFSHPKDYSYIFAMLPSCVTALGENIAYWTEPLTGSEVVNLWWKSPPHHANIVGNFTYQASASFASNGKFYYEQIFAKGCETKASVSTQKPKPTVKPATKQVAKKDLPNTSIK